MDILKSTEHPMAPGPMKFTETGGKQELDIRKHVLEYTMSQPAERSIYSQRRQVLEGEDLKENIIEMIKTLVENTMDMYTSHSPYPEEWDLKRMLDYCEQLFLPEHNLTPEDLLKMSKEEVREALLQGALEYYERREKELGSEIMRQLERFITLKVVDQKWMDHLDAMDQLRQGIGLRAYGQQDPLVQYKLESYQMFNDMVAAIQEDTVRLVLRANVVKSSGSLEMWWKTSIPRIVPAKSL